MNIENLVITKYMPLAEQGDAEAQYDLGSLYQFGHKSIQNLDEAIKWYTLAAEQGHTEAQHCLGLIYGSPYYSAHSNREEAIKWYKLAAEKGHAEAQIALDFYYAHEKLTSKNRLETAEQALDVINVQSVNENEILRIFSKLSVKGQVEVLTFAYKTEENEAALRDKDIS